ncbi:hypothetical protein FRB93_007007 [Tulasnella sp. JGI-2019a]|nr:hypothetical protein FRB93_007007 [Tulasnella sp. JGI-2019a]
MHRLPLIFCRPRLSRSSQAPHKSSQDVNPSKPIQENAGIQAPKPSGINVGPAIGAVKLSLGTLQALPAAVPFPGVQFLVGAALQVITIAQSMVTNRSDCDELRGRVFNLMLVILTPLQGSNEDKLGQGTLKANLDQLADNLIMIADELRAIRTATSFRQISTLTKSFFGYADIQQRILTCSSRLNWAMEFFQVESTIQSRIAEIQRRSELIQAILHILLQPADARFDSGSREGASSCLEGTHIAVLQEIQAWVYGTRPDQPSVFWLYGLAGAGKTTISQTVSEYCKACGILGATFFFSRDQADRSDPLRVFSTIAYQLSLSIPTFQPGLLSAVETDPQVRLSSLRTQLHKLIVEPLHAVVDALTPLVIVLDALDECGGRSSSVDILQLLADAILRLPSHLRVRILITSRPGPQTQSLFTSSRLKSLARSSALHDIQDHVVNADIRLYIYNRLQDVASNEEMDRLGKLAKGLFIFASTASDFILDIHYSNPQRQLRILLAGDSEAGSSPFRNLDQLYLGVLISSLPVSRDDYLERRLQKVLGSVTLLFDTLSPASLDMLLHEAPGTVNSTLTLLQAVIVTPQSPGDGNSLRVIHPSFSDFLTSPARCTDSRFFVDPVFHHSALSQPYVKLVETGWSSLTSDVESFCRTNLLSWLEVLSLIGRFELAIPLLKLAQRWLKENDSSSIIVAVVKDAQRFTMRFFRCISMSAAHVYFSALPLTPHCNLYDIYQHELTDSVTVRKGQEVSWDPYLWLKHTGSTVHCVAVSPDGNTIASASSDGTVGLWEMETGTRIAKLTGHTDLVTSVIFTPDGNRILSTSGDGTIRSWNATTGAHLATLKGYTSGVTSVAVSPDGTRLISGSQDHTARIWDSNAGVEVVKLERHLNTVHFVVFSPDGTCAISMAPLDNNIQFWDASSGRHAFTLEGHTDTVTSIAISSDGTRLASASLDKSIRLWNMTSGAHVSTLTGRGGIRCVASSSDGTRVAGGCDDTIVRLWDVTTRTQVATLRGHSRKVPHVAYSPDGAFILSLSHDSTIRLWNSLDGTPRSTFQGHTGGASSAIFAPDGGARVVSDSLDRTIRQWDLSVTGASSLADGLTTSVSALAISPDGTRIASGSARDPIVYVWDAITGANIQALRGHTRGVTSVASSVAGDVLASASKDGTVLLWDVVQCVWTGTLEGHASSVRCVTISSNGRIASASNDKTVKVWDLDTRVLLFTLSGHQGAVTHTAFSADAARLISYDPAIRIWDSITGVHIATIVNTGDTGSTYTLSPNETSIAYGKSGRRTATPWEMALESTIASIEYKQGGDSTIDETSNGIHAVSELFDGQPLHWHTPTDLSAAMQSLVNPLSTMSSSGAVSIEPTVVYDRPWVMLSGKRLFFVTLTDVTKTAARGLSIVISTTHGQIIILDFTHMAAAMERRA